MTCIDLCGCSDTDEDCKNKSVDVNDDGCNDEDDDDDVDDDERGDPKSRNRGIKERRNHGK